MKAFATRAVVATLGGGLIAGVTLAAMADPVQYGDESVDVKVEIEALDDDGVLAMSVDGNEVILNENGSTDLVRQFTGALPEVTVTDTRSADALGDLYWYVLGQASDFAGPDTIPAENMGWEPFLTEDAEEDEVMPGDRVDTVLDAGPNNVGLVDQELLFMAWDSAEAVDVTGEWKASADLFLKTDPDITAGEYASVLTLSLWEDEF